MIPYIERSQELVGKCGRRDPAEFCTTGSIAGKLRTICRRHTDDKQVENLPAIVAWALIARKPCHVLARSIDSASRAHDLEAQAS